MHPVEPDIDSTIFEPQHIYRPSNFQIGEASLCNYLPTPPNSTRTSLEELQHQPASPCKAQTPAKVAVPPPTKAILPPDHPTPPPSPSSTSQETYHSILRSFKNIADGTITRVVFQDVIPATYNMVLETATNNGDWDAVRVDYNEGVLIVHCPSLGHEILPELFDVMRHAGTSYPREYHGSKITQGGSSTITLEAGSKSPDFSLYEVKESSRQVEQVTNGIPTIAFEVGHWEGERKLTMDAGRLICLSKGMIQLVVTIDIDHEVEKQNHGRRKLKSVIWTHWEMDAEYPQIVGKGDTYELNKLLPERDGKIIKDTETVQPVPDAYRAVVRFAKIPHWVRAYKSNTYKVSKPVVFCIQSADFNGLELFPDQGIRSIPILYGHLFRDPQEKDLKRPAFVFQTVDIMATIHSHETIRREIDGKNKKIDEDVDSVDQELLKRLKKRRSDQ
ncbi:uncharacterized protein EDB93DRAFT_1257451 [Suillus bovinus]|uniref:uncharacterized protein n=1 Tax=Suillus bovinus TaxID=48563 RepID=UPI001B8837AC|nr:uncharacterized protein EDB93DRAFT_1257451 [Suillus bovinus]KAG2126631.1 hypothetical protein EDB93DRAFT_1257451 [Suillus bovinus]